MPRRKKRPDPTVEEVPAVTPGGSEPAAAPSTPASPNPSAAADGAEEPPHQWAAGPQWARKVSLSAERGGPTADFGYDFKFKQSAIRFTEKPEPEVLEALGADGWRWRAKERYHTKQIDKANPRASREAAEEFFEQLIDGMRARRGLSDSPAVG